jgi:hypothetical protein
LTALKNHAELKDAKPIPTAIYGPIIGKAFYYGKSGVRAVFQMVEKSDEARKTFRLASKKMAWLHIWLPLMVLVTA